VDGVNGSNTKLMPSNNSGSTANFCFAGLEIKPGNTFDIRSISGTNGDGKTFSLYGDLVNNGTFETRTGTVVFSGNAGQNISGNSTTAFYNLEIDKNTQSVQCNAPVSVTNTLALTRGVFLTTTANTLTVGPNGTSSIGNSLSYIDGPFVNQVAQSGSKTLYFPIGSNGKYRPAELTVNHNSTASASYWGQVVNAAAAGLSYSLPADLSRVSLTRYWQVVRSGASNLVNASLRLYYGADDGVTDFNSLRVAAGSGTNWLNLGGTGSANSSGNILSGSFSTFNSVYTLGNATGGNNVLPVTWINFKVTPAERRMMLQWSTGTEVNCDHFEVERSINGNEFSFLGRVAGSGNSTTTQTYYFDDADYAAGTLYYRIRQVDYDGNAFYSVVRSGKFNTPEIHIGPTVVQDGSIYIYSGEKINTITRIFDTSGNLVKEFPINMFPGERSNFSVENLASGIYIVSLAGLDPVQRIIIQ
jgi:hypothetical protein